MTPSLGPPISVSRIREAARARAAATSMRAAAAEVGMSFAAFRDFLSGSEPYQANRDRLLAWYKAHEPGRLGTLEDAVSALVSFLREEDRNQAATEILSLLERYRR